MKGKSLVSMTLYIPLIISLLVPKCILYGEKVSRGESFAREKKREILGIYFRECPTESFSREKNFRELRVLPIRFC